MSFSDPGFEGMNLDELRTWMSSNDLSAASYQDLLNALNIDLPTALPGVVQSSLGGDPSSTSFAQPTQGSILVWDDSQGLYVPSTVAANAPDALLAPWGFVSGSSTTIPNNAFTNVTWNTANLSKGHGMVMPTGAYFTVPTTGLYLVTSKITTSSLTPANTGFLELLFAVNGTALNIATDTVPLYSGAATDFPSVDATRLVSIPAGEQISVQMYQNGSASALNINGGYFQIVKVSN